MAPFGKIYTYPNNGRVQRIQAIANMSGLEIEFPEFQMGVSNKTEEFLAKFPLGKVPAFEGADGFCLTESSAIAYYVANSGSKADQLLGSDPQTQAQIYHWSVFSETELATAISPPIYMLVFKFMPVDEARINSSMQMTERVFKSLEASLKGGKKYLVGDQLTMADIMVNSFFYFAFKYMVDAELRKEIPNVVAYAQAFATMPEHKALFGELEMCEKRLSL
ncbi:glutathione S-transferase [Xylariaceae sp. FL0255]|nr:glutathione S-transferase [Xylariaceae sp. FL0255]